LAPRKGGNCHGKPCQEGHIPEHHDGNANVGQSRLERWLIKERAKCPNNRHQRYRSQESPQLTLWAKVEGQRDHCAGESNQRPPRAQTPLGPQCSRQLKYSNDNQCRNKNDEEFHEPQQAPQENPTKEKTCRYGLPEWTTGLLINPRVNVAHLFFKVVHGRFDVLECFGCRSTLGEKPGGGGWLLLA
jgi:hypothetical protein